MPLRIRHHDRRALLKTIGALGSTAALSAFGASGHVAWAAPARPMRVDASPRIVSLSWAGAQMLLSIGIAPIAVTERFDYPRAGALPPMPEPTLDLGSHDEPNLELLEQLAPELIVIDTNQTHLASRLATLAPTFTVDIYDAQHGRPYARAVAETRRLATRVGCERDAQRYLDAVGDALAACARTVSMLGTLPPILVVDLYDDGRHLYLYGPNSLMQDVMDQLGVRNAWPGSTDSGYLLQGIEALAAYRDASMFYISHGASDRIALHNLSRSLLWQHLPFVRDRRVEPLPGFFAYGALSSAVQFAQALTAGLVALGSQTERAHG
ncbi:ABC transporter substrate-binding protein [Pararobbsia silviterrae]|uniref:Fe/B12 periplasmic-binding domain-containing protein n=1 Tax=Pararobbsia silviterrae TaxID=1792498 RepID=A0A494XV95_9BURK|nr:ABC transporter substrate-binding protein [Pararobbsia silviterrae]RKP53643.1 hypothetical protein D7S86_15335 [Pararobbsia silviterrae]